MLNSSKWLQWACVVLRGSCKREVSIESWRQEAVLWYLNEMESDCAWHLAGLQWPLALCPCLLGQYHYTKLSDTQVCNLASSLPFVPLCLFNTNIHRVCRLVPVKCTHPHVPFVPRGPGQFLSRQWEPVPESGCIPWLHGSCPSSSCHHCQHHFRHRVHHLTPPFRNL